MSKIVRKSNYRIVVEQVETVYGIKLSDSTIEVDRKEMIEQIKRHVDNVHSVYSECDKEEICSFCGYSWELDEETGEPVCCDKAIYEHNEQLAKEANQEP